MKQLQLEGVEDVTEDRSLSRSACERAARTVLGGEAYEQSLAWAAGELASGMIANVNFVGVSSDE